MRCSWAGDDPQMVAYHDTEWGVPTHDERKHYEFLVLEAAQAGLSWRTVLHKREGYRRQFADFDPGVVATFGPERIEAMLLDPGIVRNRAKVTAAVHNASKFLLVQQEFGTFSRWLWNFVDGRPVDARRVPGTWPATTELSDRVSKALKGRGFKFVGSTVIYAHLQATGLVNDHATDCFRYGQLSG